MASAFDEPSDSLRPVVRTAGSNNYGMWAFFAVLLFGGFWLFSTLNAAREAAQAPAVFPTAPTGERITAPPPIAMPAPERSLPREPLQRELPEPATPRVVPRPAPPVAPALPAITRPDPPLPVLEPQAPSVVFERPARFGGAQLASDNPASDSVTASRLSNPSFTVSQGTIIPAVLETAFDSTRPGRVRALVQRDIQSFDGTRVLVPRGSRLFGEYEAGINPGERRALITWTRLLRPDGVSIALDSPASDPLGRGGVEGDVNSRFFARFGGALLQTVLNLGVGVAAGELSGGGTIVALPGSTQNITNTGPQEARPVLEIDHGTSVSVYVARDLDFSSVDR